MNQLAQRLQNNGPDQLDEAAAAMAQAVDLANAAATELLQACGLVADRARRVSTLHALPTPFREAANGLASSLETAVQNMNSALSRK